MSEAVGEAVSAVADAAVEAVSAVADVAVAAVGAAVEAASEAVAAVASIGNDMTPEVREQAQNAVVPAVIVTQIAGAVSAIGSTMSRPSGGGGGSTSNNNPRGKENTK